MKYRGYELEKHLQKGPQALPGLVMVYGDDSGAVNRLVQQVLATTGVDLTDPFAADVLDVEDILAEPARLADAAGTISLMGGLKVVRVKGVSGDLPGEQLTKVKNAVEACLQTLGSSVCVVLGAPRVDAKHSLVKLVEKHDQAAAVRLFQDRPQDLQSLIQQTCRQQGKTMTPDAQAFLVENLGADQGTTALELEKIMLYVGDRAEITQTDVAQSLSSAPASDIFKLCDAVGQRDLPQAERLLEELLEAGEAADTILILAVRHLRRVLLAKEEWKRSHDQKAACMAVRPPVNFNQQGFMQQVKTYPLSRLHKLAERGLEAQFTTREQNLPPELHLRRFILGLAA